MASSSRMGALDALFLYAEDGTAHMHIGSCAVFAGPGPSLGELSALIESKLHLVGRFRQRVRFVPGNVGRPVWVDDPAFDLAAHVHRVVLPEPGGDAALEQLMNDLMAGELPRDRPLWDMWLVDGLDGQHWAMISKVHHCMVDGISGTDLMAALLDATPDTEVIAAPGWQPTPGPSSARLLWDAVVDVSIEPARAVAAVVRGTSGPQRLMRGLRDTASGLLSLGRSLSPRPVPASVSGTIGPQRRWAAARCELADMQSIKSVFGGSVNDVVLNVVTGAFRELLIRHGESPERLRMSALVPVSIRSGDDHSFNNQVSMIIAELPIQIDDPLDRLNEIQSTMQQLKASHQVDAGAAVFNALDHLPPTVFALAARSATAIMRRNPQHIVDTVITNVPGPRRPLYALGQEMIEYLPFVPIGEGVRLGVAVLTYNGGCRFGVTGDGAAEIDVHLLARHIEAGVTQLLALAQPAARRRART